MKKTLLALCSLLWCCTLLAAPGGKHRFELKNNDFILDGKPLRIISGELHPSRIPAEYWRHRIRMVKAMGCNTVACYVMWNHHESRPGLFDFEHENRNLEAFIRIVQEESMYLLFRPGPYVCAEWDFGGLPWWLLSTPDIRVRCSDERYMAAVERYFRALAPLIRKYEIGAGGPILMVQVENEYGSYGNDRAYIERLAALWRELGVSVPFYTADGPTEYMLEAGTLDGAAVGLDPAASSAAFAVAERMRPDAPVFTSELYPGWLTHWRERWQRPSVESIVRDVKWLLDNGRSFNYYVLHGGTNFGFTAGANSGGAHGYQPDVTSYDYDAPIDEAGRPTEKYHALRELTRQYVTTELPDIPEAPMPLISFPAVRTQAWASVWENLPEARTAPQPLTMETLGQGGGYVLYRTRLTGHRSGTLSVRDLHDFATVFLNGRFIGTLDRTEGRQTIELPVSNGSEPPVLDILVEGMGRINFAAAMIDRKGITDRVTLNGMTLMNWEHYSLPFDPEYVAELKPGATSRPGLFFRAEVELDDPGDCFIDVRDFTKGVLYVNGRNLGRYWNVGPQQRLFCPGVWLRRGLNEIVLFDMVQTEPGRISGETSME